MKDSAKDAVKLGGKEFLKQTTENVAFYGGSCALSKAGIDQKSQLGFMIAVMAIGHGKNAKSSLGKISWKARGISEGGFLDRLRLSDKAEYKNIMTDLKSISAKKVAGLNEAGKFNNLFEKSRNLKAYVKNVDKLNLSESQRGSFCRMVDDLAKGEGKISSHFDDMLKNGGEHDIIKEIGKYEKNNVKKLLNVKQIEKITESKYKISGEEWFKKFQHEYGKENVEWTSKVHESSLQIRERVLKNIEECKFGNKVSNYNKFTEIRRINKDVNNDIEIILNPETTIDYSYKFKNELVNFNDGYEIKDVVDKDLILVQYSSDAPNASLCYWTTVDEANRITTLDEYMDKLALSKDWGNRNTVKVARIKAGTRVKHAVGTAREQLLIADQRPGGGVQYLFNQFDTSWIKEIRKFPG